MLAAIKVSFHTFTSEVSLIRAPQILSSYVYTALYGNVYTASKMLMLIVTQQVTGFPVSYFFQTILVLSERKKAQRRVS